MDGDQIDLAVRNIDGELFRQFSGYPDGNIIDVRVGLFDGKTGWGEAGGVFATLDHLIEMQAENIQKALIIDFQMAFCQYFFYDFPDTSNKAIGKVGSRKDGCTVVVIDEAIEDLGDAADDLIFLLVDQEAGSFDRIDDLRSDLFFVILHRRIICMFTDSFAIFAVGKDRKQIQIEIDDVVFVDPIAVIVQSPVDDRKGIFNGKIRKVILKIGKIRKEIL